MLPKITWIALLITLLAGSAQLIAASSTHPPGDSTMMTTHNDIQIQTVSLIVWEEQTPPPGTQPSRDREIGFASVVISLANTSQQVVPVTIQQVQVRNFLGSQMATPHPITLTLNPLERVDYPIRLTNQTGFRGFGPMRAIATLQIHGETQVVESAAIAVRRY